MVVVDGTTRLTIDVWMRRTAQTNETLAKNRCLVVIWLLLYLSSSLIDVFVIYDFMISFGSLAKVVCSAQWCNGAICHWLASGSEMPLW